MSSRRLALALAVALGVIVVARCRGGAAGERAAASEGAARTISANSNASPSAPVVPTISAKSNAPAAEADPLPPLPRSLEGTEVDGAFTLDEAGHLAATAHLRRRFDYFLTAEGEESLAIIRARVASLAAQELSPDNAAAALALFDRYCAYRDAGVAMVATDPPPVDPAAAMDRLRRDHFGADANQFFATE